jgi:hypothetical protein
MVATDGRRLAQTSGSELESSRPVLTSQLKRAMELRSRAATIGFPP